jgi:hypothetical protein
MKALFRGIAFVRLSRSTAGRQDDSCGNSIPARLVRLEQRLKIVELEQKGGIDLTKFYKKENENGNGALDN